MVRGTGSAVQLSENLVDSVHRGCNCHSKFLLEDFVVFLMCKDTQNLFIILKNKRKKISVGKKVPTEKQGAESDTLPLIMAPSSDSFFGLSPATAA